MNNLRPKHIGIIPDGGRRWAKVNNVNLLDSYVLSMKLLGEMIELIFRKEVRIISLYLLSKENLKRKQYELEMVYTSEINFVKNILPAICNKYDCRAELAGNKDLLPLEYQHAIEALLFSTSNNSINKLYLLIAYHPLDELFSSIAYKPNLDTIFDTLWVREPVDLIIRTGGGKLLSNFLPLQSGYAEFVFLDELFNDISLEKINQIIDLFPLEGHRLFGK